MEFEFRSEVFEGPLHLLLHLIKKNKIDIYDIPIALLADQFLSYLESCRERSLDLSSEFLDVASDLFEIKSRMLLPLYEEDAVEFDFEQDPRRELIERLLEYKKVVRRRECLEELYEQFSDRFFREDPIDPALEQESEPEEEEQVLESELIATALRNVIRNMGEIDHLRYKFFERLKQMQSRQIGVEQRSAEILERFRDARGKSLHFEDLLSALEQMEIIVTFLAVLELMKIGKISASQEGEEIVLRMREQEPV